MTADLAGFTDIVVREAELAGRFVGLLEREKAVLTEGRAEALGEAVKEKEVLAAELNELTRERGRRLAEEGLTPDRTGMDDWLARHPEQEEARAAWNRTLAGAAQAKEINRLNGELIRMQMEIAAQALEILQRKESRLDLYGPDGRSTSPSAPRIDHAV
ncbi:MAG: flagellar protein FlgN [Candidatus Accumulibacter sp.]|jgi:flagella synthesis protein FlgN|nr:flagellar protein FlgN [Accumulibacter sp.]